MGKSDKPRLVILGAGPVGLEAALYARTLGLDVRVFERGRVGEHVQRWGHVRLFSPFGMNVTPLGRAALLKDQPSRAFPADSDCLTGKEHVKAYLEPLANCSLLDECIHKDTQVLHIARRGFLKEDGVGDAQRGKQPFLLLVREGKNRERIEEADVVVDCTGTYGQHRWLGEGGIPAMGESAVEATITYGLENILGERKLHYAGKNILVVGGGYSAATTVCQLADLANENQETWTLWLARGQSTQPIRRIANDPLKERDRLAVRANTLATRGEGNVEFHHQAVVTAIDSLGPDKGFRVTARLAGKERNWEVDRVIANVGYSPDTNLYRELQVHECFASLGPMSVAAALLKQGATDCLAVAATGPATLRNPEPNFFILGAKSFGRNSHFLIKTGFEQVRDVFTLITGQANLDLYKKR